MPSIASVLSGHVSQANCQSYWTVLNGSEDKLKANKHKIVFSCPKMYQAPMCVTPSETLIIRSGSRWLTFGTKLHASQLKSNE